MKRLLITTCLLGVGVRFPAIGYAQAIIISDGPGTSKSASASSSNPQISDGPSTTSSSHHPNIVTTDGPSQPAYIYPPPIVVSNGPSTLPYAVPTRSGQTMGVNGGVVVSDGPGTSHSLNNSKPAPKVFIIDGPEPLVEQVKHRVRHTVRVAQSKKKTPVPIAEASTLAPLVPTQPPAAPQTPPSGGSMWKAATFTFGLLTLALLTSLIWAYRKRVF